MKKELFVEMTSAEMRSVEGGSPLTETLWEIAKDLWRALNSDGKPQVQIVPILYSENEEEAHSIFVVASFFFVVIARGMGEVIVLVADFFRRFLLYAMIYIYFEESEVKKCKVK